MFIFLWRKNNSWFIIVVIVTCVCISVHVFGFVHVHEDLHANQRSALYVFLNQVSFHLTLWDRLYHKTWHSLIQVGWIAITSQESSCLSLPSLPFLFYVCSGNPNSGFQAITLPTEPTPGTIIKNMYVYKYMKTSPLILLCMPWSLLWLNYLYISEALSFIYLICMLGKQSHGLSFRLQHLPNTSANFASFSAFAINSAWTDILKFSALYILLVLTLIILFQHWHSCYLRCIIFKYYLFFPEYGCFIWWPVWAPCAWGAPRNQNRPRAN